MTTNPEQADTVPPLSDDELARVRSLAERARAVGTSHYPGSAVSVLRLLGMYDRAMTDLVTARPLAEASAHGWQAVKAELDEARADLTRQNKTIDQLNRHVADAALRREKDRQARAEQHSRSIEIETAARKVCNRFEKVDQSYSLPPTLRAAIEALADVLGDSDA